MVMEKMTAEEFEQAIDQVNLSQIEAAEFFGVNERSSRRWISGQHAVPQSVAMLLRVMVNNNITPEQILTLCKGE